MMDCINCDTLNIAKPQTKTVVKLAQDFLRDDIEIILEPHSVTDQKGYVLFNGCTETTIESIIEQNRGNCACRTTTTERRTSCGFDEDKFEIVKFCNAEVLSDGTVRLYNLVRGLNWYGEDSNTSYPNYIKDHHVGDMVKVGSFEVHYYWVDLYKCIEELRSNVPCQSGLSV